LGTEHYFFFQRALAARAAICERFLGVSMAALAAPPLSPPSLPSSTAAGFLGFGGSVFGAWPVDSSITWNASALASRGRVFERSGIATFSMTVSEKPSRGYFKLTHYRLQGSHLKGPRYGSASCKYESTFVRHPPFRRLRLRR
jgi:hypothetical protein